MTSKQKLILGVLLVTLIFFVSTFVKNWGSAVSENLLEKYKPVVKTLQNNPKEAKKQCPLIVKKLQASIPDLQKSQEKNQDLLAYKLIADCYFAAQAFQPAAESYQKLVEAEPQVAKWHGLVAEAYFNIGKFGDALPPSILAAQLDPSNFELRLLNARILAKIGLKNRTIEAYFQAIKIAPFDDLAKTKAELEQFEALHAGRE